jgi:general stress protein 26
MRRSVGHEAEETMELHEVIAETTRLSNYAYIATVGRDGNPDVVPIWPAWQDGTVWILAGTRSVKVRNIAHNPNVALHWQVNESGDGVEVWGTASVHTDIETKRRLWTGVFSYNLDDFVPDGPESPDACFVTVRPQRALALKQFGMAGRDTWQARGEART